MELQLQAKALLGEPVAEALNRHHEGAVPAHTCASCASSCCSRGGFAILENVLQIYDRYQADALRRADYQFAGGLSFVDFVFKYFDVVQWRDDADPEVGLALFHMKSLGPGGNLVSIPPMGYYPETRDLFFDFNPWLNKGCIFLSEAAPAWPHDDRRTARGCILHNAESATNLTAKPIDCVFYACETPFQTKPVNPEAFRQWLLTLATTYPDSIARFDELMKESPRSVK